MVDIAVSSSFLLWFTSLSYTLKNANERDESFCFADVVVRSYQSSSPCIPWKQNYASISENFVEKQLARLIVPIQLECLQLSNFSESIIKSLNWDVNFCTTLFFAIFICEWKFFDIYEFYLVFCAKLSEMHRIPTDFTVGYALNIRVQTNIVQIDGKLSILILYSKFSANWKQIENCATGGIEKKLKFEINSANSVYWRLLINTFCD